MTVPAGNLRGRHQSRRDLNTRREASRRSAKKPTSSSQTPSRLRQSRRPIVLRQVVAGWRQSDSGELSDQSPRVFGRFFLCEVSGVGHQRVVDMGKPDGAEAVQVVADLAAFLLAPQVQQPGRHLRPAAGYLVGLGVLRERSVPVEARGQRAVGGVGLRVRRTGFAGDLCGVG